MNFITRLSDEDFGDQHDEAYSSSRCQRQVETISFQGLGKVVALASGPSTSVGVAVAGGKRCTWCDDDDDHYDQCSGSARSDGREITCKLIKTRERAKVTPAPLLAGELQTSNAGRATDEHERISLTVNQPGAQIPEHLNNDNNNNHSWFNKEFRDIEQMLDQLDGLNKLLRQFKFQATDVDDFSGDQHHHQHHHVVAG